MPDSDRSYTADELKDCESYIIASWMRRARESDQPGGVKAKRRQLLKCISESIVIAASKGGHE